MIEDVKIEIAGYFLGRGDIEVYSTKRSLEHMKKMEIIADFPLVSVHGNLPNKKAIMAYDSHRLDNDDGIEVETSTGRKKVSFYDIKIDDRLLQNVFDYGKFISRYGNGERIIVSIEDDPWKRAKGTK